MEDTDIGKWVGIAQRWEWMYLKAGILMIPTGIVQIILAYTFLFSRFVTDPTSMEMMFGYLVLTWIIPAALLWAPVWWIFIPREYRDTIFDNIVPQYLIIPLWAFHMGIYMIVKFTVQSICRLITGNKEIQII